MTNLLAIAVTIIATTYSELKTNVLETAYAPAAPRYINSNYGGIYVLGNPPAAAPAEKWVTTTVERIDRLQFDWQGQRREVVASTLVSSNTVHLRIKQEWEPVK